MKLSYIVALWVAFNVLFMAQTIYYYGLHKVRYVFYLVALEVALMVLTALVIRSRRVGLPVLIALSLALGFIPYEYGIPFLLSALEGVIENCNGIECNASSIIRVMKAFALSAAYFLLLLPMLKLKQTKLDQMHISGNS
ncbi:MAG: hypothetical protein HOQ32_20410 [Lysobacter sp.]|nr:hypothetical protein [Lysobacter sp.]